MHLVELLVRTIAAAIILTAPLASQPADAQGGAGADNAACLGCHGTPGFAAPGTDAQERPLFVPADQFGQSVHAALPCVTCHAGTAEMPHKIAPASAAERRRQNPEFCGGCHADALADYRASVHGRGLALGDAAAAVCSDCHGTHTVARPQSAASRLAVAQACGNCHTDAAQSFRETYHGQILALGRADTATCADCHRGHAILPSGERASSVSAPNILAVCRNCHQDAAPGFATFHAHATTDDFTRYPLEWLAAKFLLALTVSVFGLLWPHSALWFYREFRDRQQRKPRPHVRAEALPPPDTRHYLRWSATYRWAHLVFAVSFIVLALTGLPLAYPTAGWAPGLMRALGGVAVAGLVHRVAAVVMTAVFAAQVVYAVLHVARNWKAFKIFGPYSLIPNLQDAKDVWAMLKWFVGKGPRPVFDHWNYLQKVDYWGPFWGIAILATTGVLLWFTALTATYLPGWVFNVATVTHREDALFATLYLFTIHYFVNHWRPGKFPLDLVMFTGSMPLEEFKREYAVEYARLAETGELKKYLVDAPSRPMTLGSTILGFALVGIGLAVLVLIVIGIGANG